MIWPKRLFSRTLLTMILLFGVIANVVSVIHAREMFDNLIEEYRSKALAIATSIADASVELSANRDVETIQATVDVFAQLDGVSYVGVEDPAGVFLAHTFVPEVPAEIVDLDVSDGPTRVAEMTIGGLGDVLHVATPILGGVAGQVHVGMDIAGIRSRIWMGVLKIQAIIFAIFAVSVLVAAILVRRISNPLERLTQHTQAIAAAGIGGDAEAGIDAADLSSSGEIGELARSIASMERDLWQSAQRLREATANRERIESELRIASEIQQSILPDVEERLPAGLPLQIAADVKPAREVGGDLYDVIPIRDEAVYVVVGDVSGKGVPAAMFMTLTATLLRASAHAARDPAQIVGEINRDLCRDNDACMFVTLFVGLLDIASGRLRYCNGGHPPPFWIPAAGGAEPLLEHDMLLGIRSDATYHSHQAVLAPGDKLFVFSDGVTEATNADGELFGEARLGHLLAREGGASCVGLNELVLKTLESRAAGTPPADDTTLLTLWYRPGREGER